MPAVMAVCKRFPDAEIHCLTNALMANQSGMADLYEDTVITQYISFSKADTTIYTQVKQGRYDMVIELPQALDTFYTQIRNMLLFRVAGIRYGAGWEVSTTFLFRRLQLKYLRFEREPQRLLKLLIKYKIIKQAAEQYAVKAEHFSDVAELPVPYIVMAVGAKSERSRWPLDNFRVLAERLMEQTDLRIVLIGNSHDFQATQTWSQTRVINLCGRTSLKQASSVISGSEFYVGNDTGLMHLAAAFNKPVVAVFSAKTYPNKWYPSTTEQYIHADYSVPCAICSTRPCADNICMQHVTVDDVWNSIMHLMNKQTKQ